jgi:hypothetical protein
MCRVLLALGVFLACSPAALADDCEAPCMGSTITIDLNEDWTFAADPSELKANSLLPEVESESFFQPFDWLKLVSDTKIEQVIEPEPGANSGFSDVGIYTAELYAEVTFDPVTIRAGKFDPVFSLASVVADGFHSTDLADIDASERLGAEGSIAFEAFDLNHSLTAAAFTLDRTFLAKSYITKRDVPDLNDGGVGNAKGVSSFSLVLDGCKGKEPDECYEDGDFGYRLATSGTAAKPTSRRPRILRRRTKSRCCGPPTRISKSTRQR